MIEASVVIPGETLPRIAATAETVDLLRKLWGNNGPLMFHQ